MREGVGRPATAEDVAATVEDGQGGQCSICQDDFESPVVLPCGHVFCEGCVGTWFAKGERTCPLCRQKFNTPAHMEHMSGQTPLAPQLF